MGLFDALSAQTPQGEQLRAGLLGAGAGLLSGSTGNYGQFAPAMAQGFAGFGAGQQNAQKQAMERQKYEMMMAEAQRKQQMQQMQMQLAQRMGGMGGVSGGAPAGGGTATSFAGGGAIGSGQPQGSANSGGGMPSYQELVSMAVAGVPGAKEALDAWKYSQEGIERKQGNTYVDPITGQERYMPQLPEGVSMQGGQVQALPGYLNTIGAIEGAKTGATEAAKYPYTIGGKREDAALDPNTYVDENGIKRFATRAQMASAAQDGKPMAAEADTKVAQANEVMGLALEASQYLDDASSGMFSAAKTGTLDALGVDSKSSKADAQLKVIAGQMVGKMPRFEGPQSDKDVALYREMAGNIGNSLLPIPTRKAALQTVIKLNKKYLEARGQSVQQEQLSQGGPAQPDSIPTISDASQLQGLPSGTVFRAPDGSMRRVP